MINQMFDNQDKLPIEGFMRKMIDDIINKLVIKKKVTKLEKPLKRIKKKNSNKFSTNKTIHHNLKERN